MLLTTLGFCGISIKTLSSFFITFVDVSLNSYAYLYNNRKRIGDKEAWPHARQGSFIA